MTIRSCLLQPIRCPSIRAQVRFRKPARETVFNAPLRPGDGTDHFKEAFESRILPAVADFSPDLILISAGFDAHHRDPLANLELTGNDFDWATGKLMELAGKHCDDRLVSMLEGGYDLEGLGRVGRQSCQTAHDRIIVELEMSDNEKEAKAIKDMSFEAAFG